MTPTSLVAAFAPSPNHTYFAHLAASLDSRAVGLVLVHVGSGRLPCLGLDSDTGDNYVGDVLRNTHGQPEAGVVVQYFTRDETSQDRTVSENGTGLQFVTETRTDSMGRHRVLLQPGRYVYRYILPSAVDGAALALDATLRPVEVLAGRSVAWADVTALPAVLGDDAPDVGDVPLLQREIGYMTEHLILDWNRDDEDWTWLDVEETVAALGRKLSDGGAELRQITMAGWPRPEIVVNWQGRGLVCIDTRWTDKHFALAYRNFRAIMEARYYDIRNHERANQQMQRSVKFINEKKVGAMPGQQRYLADARAAALYWAAQAGAYETGGAMGLVIERAASVGPLGQGLRPGVTLPVMLGGTGRPVMSESDLKRLGYTVL